MTFDLAQMIAALQDRTMSWVGDGSQSDPLCTQAAAEIIRLTARVEWLEGALNGMLQSVCGPTGFAEAVRHNSGHAYPWHSLDDAEAKARAALSTHTEEPKT